MNELEAVDTPSEEHPDFRSLVKAALTDAAWSSIGKTLATAASVERFVRHVFPAA